MRAKPPRSSYHPALSVSVLLGAAVSSGHATAQCTTPPWSALGSGTSGRVNAVVTLPNGDLVAAGLFTTAGGVAANNVARWDGTNWSPLASGTNHIVVTLLALPNGDVVAGGWFSMAGGVPANRIARWNGTNWSPLGGGMSVTGVFPPATVRDLALMPNGDLVACGLFSSPAASIARWNGFAWLPLGTGMSIVDAVVAMPNGDLIASGPFTTAGGVNAQHIARWNGTGWAPLGSGISGGNLYPTAVFDLTLVPGGVVAGGNFSVAGGTPANNIARWNGASWSAMGIGTNDQVHALTTMPNGDVVAAGIFTTAGGIEANHIARWDGARWWPLGSGMNDAVAGLRASANGDLVAGGDFTSAGGAIAGHVARLPAPRPADASLTTTFDDDDSGAVGGAVYFDLVPSGDVTLRALGANLASAVGTVGTIDVYATAVSSVGKELDPSEWTLLASGPVSAAGVGVASHFPLGNPLSIPAGQSIGVALVAHGVAHAYTIGGPSVPSVYEGCALTLTANAAADVPFTGGLIPSRVVNACLYYTQQSACAAVQERGRGCTSAFASFYEVQTVDGMDLRGMRVDGTSLGGAPNTGYSVTTVPLPGSFLPGSGATALVLGDDDQVAVGTLGLVVGSNGWLATGAGNSNAFEPSVEVFLGNPFDAIAAWTDLDPTASGSGQIWYEEVGSTAIVTYDGVYGWTLTSRNHIQIHYDTVTGNFSILFGLLSGNNTQQWLVGFAPGGPSADPGGSDISGGGFTTAAADILPLALSAVGRPVQGPVGVGFDVLTQHVDANAVLHLGLVGLSSPGDPLAPLGFGPGDCYLHASPDVAVGPAVVFGGGGAPVAWTALDLPAAPPSFVGLEFYLQAATLDLGLFSPAGRVSNGLRCVIGDR